MSKWIAEVEYARRKGQPLVSVRRNTDRGLNGPCILPEGKKRPRLLSVDWLVTHGLLPVEPPLTDAVCKEVCGAVLLAIGEAADRTGIDRHTRMRLFRLFLPVLTKLVPIDDPAKSHAGTREIGEPTRESTEGQLGGTPST